MAEDWLYEKTLEHITTIHSLDLQKLLNFRGRISLPSLTNAGTPRIQIDIVAADLVQKIILLSECKEFLTFQGASECAEQLSLKTFLLRNYLSGSIGNSNHCILDSGSLREYRLIQYISLGSNTGTRYRNARCSRLTELNTRMDYYKRYIEAINRVHIGLILFLNKDTIPIESRATIQNWIAEQITEGDLT